MPEQRTDFIFTAVGEQLGPGRIRPPPAAVRHRGVAHLASGHPGPGPGRHAHLRRRAGHAGVPGVREHRHDDGHHAGRRHPPPAHELRRLGGDRHLRRHRPGPQRPHAPVQLTRSRLPRPARSRRKGRAATLARDMTSLWPQIEPILAHVQKPARYIGCEDGAIGPGSLRGQGRLAADLPRRLRDRPAQPGAADPLRADQRARRRPGRARLRPLDRHGGAAAPAGAAAVLGRQPPPGRQSSICWRSTCRPSWSTPTSSTASTWPACRSERPIVAPSTRWWWPAATAPSTRSRSPTSSTCSSSATARKWSVKSPTPCRTGRPGGGRPGRGSGCCGTWRGSRACTCPSCYDVVYDGPRLVAVTPRYPDVPERVEKRTIADLAAWPYPKQQLVPMTEVVHDRLNVEIFRGCTRGCRFCQAGHDHPAGPGATGRARSGRWSATGCVAPATTRSASRRCRARTSPASTRWSRGIIDDPACRRPGVREPAQPAGRRLHGRHRHARSRRCAAPA